ncbi:MAG: LasA protease [Chloroflexota bacterium]|nr:LasA protease [Chloroflexota bacterium]
MKKTFRFALVILVLSAWLAGCVRPDDSPSPFEGLVRETPFEAQPGVSLSGPDFQIIPDSELVYGPAAADFALEAFIAENVPQLRNYSEDVDGKQMSGTEIVEQVSRDYSVNPRLLLALLRYCGADTQNLEQVFIPDPGYEGLFIQLSWAANALNRGYYVRRVNALSQIGLKDEVLIDLSNDISAGTAAVQYFFSLLYGYANWQTAVGPLGLYAAYLDWFDSPQSRAVEPLIPADLSQPLLRLPYADGESWYFTAGPHSAWGTYAAWGALDFAPPKPSEDAWGCYDSTDWVRAMADGRVVRVADGLVVQELDDDNNEGSGWTILYMHVAEKERVALGEILQAGDPIGHPSCEGGPATGTHLHIARRYNGEWIPADQDIPFSMSGWESAGFGVEYDGVLTKDNIEIEASGFPTDENRVYP